MLRMTLPFATAVAFAVAAGSTAPALANVQEEVRPEAGAAAGPDAGAEQPDAQADAAPEGPVPQIEGGEWHVNLVAEDGLVRMVPLSVAEELCGPEATAGAGPGEVIECAEVATDDPALETLD